MEFTCYRCHEKLVWLGDHDQEDGTVLSQYICPHCGDINEVVVENE